MKKIDRIQKNNAKKNKSVLSKNSSTDLLILDKFIVLKNTV